MQRCSSFIALTLALVFCDHAQGEIFKCVSPEGKVSYAATPCPFNRGESTVQRPGPPLLTPDTPREHVHEVHLRAIKNLQISGKTNAKVIEGENYKKLQLNRLPAPTVASQCAGKQFYSECFDPSAGQSSFDEALRRAMGSNEPIPQGLPGSMRQR